MKQLTPQQTAQVAGGTTGAIAVVFLKYKLPAVANRPAAAQ